MPYHVDEKFLEEENRKVEMILSFIRLIDNESHFTSVFYYLSDEAAQMTIKQVLNGAEACCILKRC